MPDPYEIAAWRFEQIAPLLDPSLDATQRRVALRERLRQPGPFLVDGLPNSYLGRELRLVEDTYGTDHLDLVLARGYVSKLISNARITRYLEMYHPEFLPEFEKITETEALAS